MAIATHVRENMATIFIAVDVVGDFVDSKSYKIQKITIENR